jgi:hypothetical protein
VSQLPSHRELRLGEFTAKHDSRSQGGTEPGCALGTGDHAELLRTFCLCIAALQAYFARNLERARRSIWSVTFEEPTSPVKLVVSGGDCVLTPAFFLCENHERLTGNIYFQHNLLNVLLTHERAWDAPRALER